MTARHWTPAPQRGGNEITPGIGQRRRVRIVSVRPVRNPVGPAVRIVACEALDGGETIACVLSGREFEAIEPRPEAGQVRTIEFAPGGRFGGIGR